MTRHPVASRPSLHLRLAAVLLLLTPLSAFSQNWDNPGLVPIGRGRWVTPEEARTANWFEHGDRWFPKKLKRRIAKWAREDEKHRKWAEARKLRSKHYRITSNVPRHVLELEIKPFLDELYRTYVKVFKSDFGVSAKSANNHFIRIYDGYRDYAFDTARGGQPRSRLNPGFFGGSELVCFYDETNPAQFYGTVFHEGAHQFVSAVLPGARLPIWLEEALATYFEGCTYSRATKKITVGFLCPSRVSLAQRLLQKERGDDDLALARRLFLDVPKGRFGARNYALSWSFVYYLTNGRKGKMKKPFARFLKALNGSGARSLEDVWKRATRKTLREAAKGWREFVLALEVPERPEFATIAVTRKDPAVDVRTDDRLWSLDGVHIVRTRDARSLWKKRNKDAAMELVVVRRVPVPDATRYKSTFMRVTVPAGSRLDLSFRPDINRRFSLRD